MGGNCQYVNTDKIQNQFFQVILQTKIKFDYFVLYSGYKNF